MQTENTSIKTHALAQFNAARALVDRNLEGISHEESMLLPTPAGNNLNWVVGHLVASFNELLPAVGGRPVWPDDLTLKYGRGSKPLTPVDDPLHFEKMHDDFATAHDRLADAIREFSEDRLDEPAPFSPGNNPDETITSLLYVFAFHQAYHAGQTGVLRRIAGYDGALR